MAKSKKEDVKPEVAEKQGGNDPKAEAQAMEYKIVYVLRGKEPERMFYSNENLMEVLEQTNAIIANVVKVSFMTHLNTIQSELMYSTKGNYFNKKTEIPVKIINLALEKYGLEIITLKMPNK